MKKTLLIFFIFFTVRAYSQKISYGISAGVNYTNLAGTQTLNYSPSGDYLTGFRIGGLMDIGFKAFSIQPGILYNTTGGQGRLNFTDMAGKVTDYVNNRIVLDYINIPVNLLYKIKAGSGSLFIGGGPYAGIWIAGKIHYATNKSYGTTQDLTYGDNSKEIKNPEFGLNILEGYRLNSGLAISVGYSFALTKVYTTGATNKDKGFNLSVDYFF